MEAKILLLFFLTKVCIEKVINNYLISMHTVYDSHVICVYRIRVVI